MGSSQIQWFKWVLPIKNLFNKKKHFKRQNVRKLIEEFRDMQNPLLADCLDEEDNTADQMQEEAGSTGTGSSTEWWRRDEEKIL